MTNTNRKSKKCQMLNASKQDRYIHKIPIIITQCSVELANIDEIAAITINAGNPVVTASTDSVDFLRPITTGDILSYEAMVSYAGTSSMEICVQIVIDDVYKTSATWPL